MLRGDADDDIYDAHQDQEDSSLLRRRSLELILCSVVKRRAYFGPAKTVVEQAPDEDELDALMADLDDEALQRDLQPATSLANPATAVTRDIDDDEMEAMAEMDMGDMW